MIIKIKEALYNKEDKIYEILEEIGCHNIHKITETQFRFGTDDMGSGTGNSLFIDTLHFKSFSGSKSGDIITLVSEMNNFNFNEAIRWLANKLNIKEGIIHKNIKLPFGGFFKNISKNKELDDTPPLIYPISRLNEYDMGVSKLFIDDGISALTQEEFKIGYDIVSNRITIAWFDEVGQLVGIMGRINKSIMKENDKRYKYLPIIPFSKSKVLYGYGENYKGILESNTIIVVESEKSVLKARQLGFNNVVALGGNEIHLRQQKLIKSMFCNVIIALDEGISLEHCIQQAEKCKINNPFFQNEVYVLQMNNNKYIKENKVSVMDLNKETVKKIFEEYLIYID